MELNLNKFFEDNSSPLPGSTGYKIKKYRELRNLTQKELGIRCGFSPSTADVRIAQYENGKKKPKDSMLQTLALALKLDEFALYDDDLLPSHHVFHVLFDLEDLWGLHPVKIEDNYYLAFDYAFPEIENGWQVPQAYTTEFNDFLKRWFEMRQKSLPQLDDSENITNTKSKEYILWRGEYPINYNRQSQEGYSEITRKDVLQNEKDRINAELYSDKIFEVENIAEQTILQSVSE